MPKLQSSAVARPKGPAGADKQGDWSIRELREVAALPFSVPDCSPPACSGVDVKCGALLICAPRKVRDLDKQSMAGIVVFFFPLSFVATRMWFDELIYPGRHKSIQPSSVNSDFLPLSFPSACPHPRRTWPSWVCGDRPSVPRNTSTLCLRNGSN